MEDELMMNPVDESLAEEQELQRLQEEVNQRRREDEAIAAQQQAVEAAMKAKQAPELKETTADQQAGKDEVEVETDEKTQEWAEYDELSAEGRTDEWYQKTYGRTKEEHIKMIAENGDFAGLQKAGEMAANLAAGAGLGVIDTAVDIMALPGVDRGGLGKQFNEWWDKNTRFENPAYQAARQIMGAIIPVARLTKTAQGAMNLSKMPRIKRFLSVLGVDLGIDAGFTAISDQGAEDNVLRNLDDAFPYLQIPDSLKTLDEDDPRTRRIKNLYVSGPLSIVGNLIGHVGSVGKYVKFDWFRPKDAQAAAVKKVMQQADQPDPDTLIRIAQIDEALASGTLTKKETTVLTNTKKVLTDQIESKGYSDATSSPLESAVSKELDLEQAEMDAAAVRKLSEDPFGSYDPTITPTIGREGTTRRPAVKPGAVIRNAADNAAINKGLPGDPAPMVSENMLTKFFKAGGRSRNAVVGLMEAFRDAGDFDAKVAGFRFTKSQMDEDAFNRYVEIIGNHDLDSLRSSFVRDIKNIKGGQVEYLSEVDTQAAGFAMRDLVDNYLGRPIAAQSARLMDSLGAEVRTLAESATVYEGIVDENLVMEKVIDKLGMLSEEFALSKYIAGWQLRNKGFFQKYFSGENVDTLTRMTMDEFTEASSKAHAQAMQLRKTLMEMKDTDPKMMKPLMEAFVLSNGNVDTIDKLTKYARDAINPLNFVVNEGGMNLFSKNLTSIVLNNVLSGLSAGRAILANGVQLATKPVIAGLGHGIAAMYTKDFDELQNFSYIYSGWAETNRRSVSHAWKTLKAVNADPTSNIDLIRKDLRLSEAKEWDTIDSVAENVWKEKNIGAYAMYTWAKVNKHVAEWPLMRWGSTAMSGADGYVNMTEASKVARIRALDNTRKAGKPLTKEVLQAAEKEVMKTMFDENGRLTDFAASHMSGEIALNLDNKFADGISGAISNAPWLRHFLMFPRTGLNGLQVAGSYVGASLIPIPGFNKYAKVLYARTQEDIAEALSLHGLKNFDADPNAMAIYKYLKREYMGRLAFSASLVGALWSYAAAGNIRGNGAINAHERKLHRDTLGVRTKEIKIGGKWVSYAGLDQIEPVLTILGDYFYHARDISPEKGSDLRDRLTWTIAATFLDKTYLKGIEPLFQIIDNNETAFSLSAANIIRSYVPLSGAAGVLANAISSSQKDIYNDMIKYVNNRMPVLNQTLPEQIDFWTGKPLNDIDNPALRILNALSPIKVSDDQEDWREWLYSTGWDGMSMLRYATGGGNYEYTPEQRELIYRFIAEDNLAEIIKGPKFMGNKTFAEIIGKVRTAKMSGKKLKEDGTPFEYKIELTPVHKAINALLDEAKARAERRLTTDPKYKNIAESILVQKRIDKYMKQGRIDEAQRTGVEASSNRNQNIENLSQFYKQ